MKRPMFIFLLVLTCILPVRSQTVFFNHGQYGSFSIMTNNALSLLSPQGGAGFMTRQQWVGLDGAPRSFVGTGHVGFSQYGVTTGLSIRQDRVGVERYTESSAFFSKAIRLSTSDYLGLSMNAGLVYYVARYSSLDQADQSFRDDILEYDGLLGVGLVIYRPEVYYIGASLPRITRGGVGTFSDKGHAFQNQYHLTAGVLFGLAERIHLRPSVQAIYNKAMGVHVSASAMLFADRKVGLGLGARTPGELSALLRFHFSEFGLGYSYEFNPSNKPLNRHINNSTHEIALSYRFGGQQGLL